MSDPKALIERLSDQLLQQLADFNDKPTMMDCPHCDGRGMYYGEPCDSCGGSGESWDLTTDEKRIRDATIAALTEAALTPAEPDEATVERVHGTMLSENCCFHQEICRDRPCECASRIARAALSAIPRAEAEGWRTIESAVKDGSTEILAFDGHSVVVAAYWRKADGWWPLFSNPKTGFQVHPTHWMPLPTPPAAPKEGSR